LNNLDFGDFKIGYSGSYTTKITEEKNLKFGELTGDKNPVHFDEERMKKTHFKRRITNGIFTTTTTGPAIVKMFTTDKTMVIALEQHNSFIKPVFIGDTIMTTVKVAEVNKTHDFLWVDALIKNQHDEVVMSARFRLRILDA